MKSEQEIRTRLKTLDRADKRLSQMYQCGEIDEDIYCTEGTEIDIERAALEWVLGIKFK